MKRLEHAFPADLNTTSTSRKRCADAHFLPGCLPKLAHPDRGLDGLRDRVDRPAPPIQWKKVPVSEIQDIRTVHLQEMQKSSAFLKKSVIKAPGHVS